MVSANRFVAFAALGALATVGVAQNPHPIETIEGRICGATTVYVATIESLTGNVDSISLIISETIRGPKMETLKISRDDASEWHSRHVYESLRTAKTPVLLDNGHGRWRLLALDNKAWPMFTLDLKDAKRPGDLLHRARAFVKKYPKPLEYMVLRLPYRLAARANVLTDHNGLIIPICPEVDAVGKAILKNPKSYFAEVDAKGIPSLDAELAKMRIAAITILGSFKSEANAKLLQGLLNDPFIGPFKWEQETFPVRHAAEKALASWNEK